MRSDGKREKGTRRIYMDHHATTPVDPKVLQAMLPYFTDEYGNAASRSHAFGWRAEEAVEKSRAMLASCIGARAPEIVFTSGATESDNLALLGAARMASERGRHILAGSTEHPAVLDCCRHLETEGFRIDYLPVDSTGRLSPDDLRAAIRPDTILVTLMAANNEVGTLHPVMEIGRIAKERGVLFHCDASQAVGKIPIDVEAMGIDLLSFTAHKLHGPKGIGALYVRRKNPRVRIAPLLHGGGHERGLRPGTLNVPGIVGFAEACALAAGMMSEESARLGALRDRLHRGIAGQLDDVRLHGHPEFRLPNNLHLSFGYVEGEALMMAMDDVAVSSGSACTSATHAPSHVLRAMGVSDEAAHSSLRFGLGRFNTAEEVDYVIQRVVDSVKKLREISPLYEMKLGERAASRADRVS